MSETVAGPAARTLEWAARDTDLATVLRELGRLTAEVSRSEIDDAHPQPRNSTLNLVVAARSLDVAAAIEETAGALAAHHPLRLVTLVTGGAGDGLDASVAIHGHDLAVGQGLRLHVQAELVRLQVSDGLGTRFESLVEPLLVGDIPTVLWWLETPPFGSAELAEALSLATTLVVDSSQFERPYESALALAELVERGTPVCDLQWWRQRPWLHLLAQIFNPPDRRPLLEGVNGVGIDFAGEGRANRVAAATLAGWLASRLGWELGRGASGQGGLSVAYYSAPGGHPIEVDFRSVARPGGPQGQVLAVRLDCARGGRTASFELVRAPEPGRRVTVSARIAEAAPVLEDMTFDAPGDAELLVDAVVAAAPDRVYVAAMTEAGRLLRAFW